jgi:hypothetical protein
MKKAKGKIKKVTKRRMVEPPKVPPPPSWEYFIDEVPMSMKTEEIQKRLDELGKDGWQLLSIGPYGDTPTSARVYFMRQKEKQP